MASVTKSSGPIIRFVQRCRFAYRSVKDPRREHGRVHPLAGVLNLLMVSMASCKLPFRRAEELGADLPGSQLRRLGLQTPPSDSTLRRVSTAATPTRMHAEISRQVRLADQEGLIVNDLLACGLASFDGHGSGGGKGEAPNADCRQTVHDAQGSLAWDLYTLRAYLVSSSAHPCLGQEIIHRDEGEPTRFPVLFKRLCRSMGHLFKVVIADAGITSRENARLVRLWGKHFIFALKANFRTLYPQAWRLLETARVAAETVERAQGRTVHHLLRRISVPEEFDFPDATQLWMVEREVIAGDGSPRQYGCRIFVVSLPWKRLSPDQILRAIRLHWAGTENGGNWTADMILDEDSYLPNTKGQASALLCWLRVLAYNLLTIFRAQQPRKDRHFIRWKRAAERLRDVLLLLKEVDPALNL